MSEQYIVYALVELENNTVRYIGATKQSLRQRLAGHMSEARKVDDWEWVERDEITGIDEEERFELHLDYRCYCDKCCWIRRLGCDSAKVGIEPLTCKLTEREALFVEEKITRSFSKQLVNTRNNPQSGWALRGSRNESIDTLKFAEG